MRFRLTGWARLWLVVSLVWLLCVIPVLAVVFPFTNSTSAFVSEQRGTFWNHGIESAEMFAAFHSEMRGLHRKATGEGSSNLHFVIASQIVEANSKQDDFGLVFKHSVFVNEEAVEIEQSNSSSRTLVRLIELDNNPLVRIVRAKVAKAFPERGVSDVELTAKAIVEEIDIVEREWPARIAEDIEIRNDQKMTAWIGGGAIALIPPVLVWLLFFVVRWIYRGFKADKDIES